MQLDVFTLIPQAFAWLTEQRPVAAVLGDELDLRLFSYRDYTPLSASQVDDEPYGGGAGMVLRVDVVAAALEIDLAYAGLDERERQPGIELEHVVRDARRDLGDAAERAAALLLDLEAEELESVVLALRPVEANETPVGVSDLLRRRVGADPEHLVRIANRVGAV